MKVEKKEKRYRKVAVSFWNDEAVLDLEPQAKFVFLHILTSPAMSRLGLMRHTPEGILAECGLAQELLPRIEAALFPMVRFDRAHCLVWCPNFILYNMPQNADVIRGWADDLENLPQCPATREALNHIHECLSGSLQRLFRDLYLKPGKAANDKAAAQGGGTQWGDMVGVHPGGTVWGDSLGPQSGGTSENKEQRTKIREQPQQQPPASRDASPASTNAAAASPTAAASPSAAAASPTAAASPSAAAASPSAAASPAAAASANAARTLGHARDSPDIVLTLADGEYCPSAADLAEWQRLFPQVDLQKSLCAMSRKLAMSPRNRPPLARLPAYVHGWLERERKPGGSRELVESAMETLERLRACGGMQ